MPNKNQIISTVAVISFIALLFYILWANPTTNSINSTQTALPIVTGVKIPTSIPKKSWLILPDLPDTATQADWGAEIYRLVCQDCHGDVGRGLTQEFISTWNPLDQNCWQSKCHATNHPPEGFILPRYIPAIMDDDTLARFETSLDLYEYILVNMPWHDPGNLIEEEYWQLTQYLILKNDLDPLNEPLDRSRAELLFLHENSAASDSEDTGIPDESFQDDDWAWIWTVSVILLGTVPLLVTAHWLWRRWKAN